jgi:hypothetical protein
MKDNKEFDKELLLSCRASELRDATMAYIEDGVKTWLRGGKDGDVPIDLEMWDVTIKDAYDLGCIIALIEQDKLAEAWNSVVELDTLVRDVIPTNVYDWLHSEADDRKQEHWAQLDDGQKYNA